MSTFLIRQITVDPLDAKSIQNAIDQIKEIQGRIVPALEKLVAEMAKKGVEIAKATLLEFDRPAFDTGELHDSIEAFVNGSEATVSAQAYYAAYVEFGTGLPGQVSANNPAMRDPRQKDTGTYHDGGWVYFNDRIGQFVFTYGMEGRPFMYMTYKELIEEAEYEGGRIVAEYLAG